MCIDRSAVSVAQSSLRRWYSLLGRHLCCYLIEAVLWAILYQFRGFDACTDDLHVYLSITLG